MPGLLFVGDTIQIRVGSSSDQSPPIKSCKVPVSLTVFINLFDRLKFEFSISMDNSFRDRVQKAFGSLSASQSPWSLADGEVEKREWNRSRALDDDGEGEPPYSSSFNGGLEVEIEDLGEENDDDDDEENGGKFGDGADRDEWEIRSSIGMDCTLDNEVFTILFLFQVRICYSIVLISFV